MCLEQEEQKAAVGFLLNVLEKKCHWEECRELTYMSKHIFPSVSLSRILI